MAGGAPPSTPAPGDHLAIGIDASLTSTGLVALGVETGECASAVTLEPSTTGVLRLAQIRDQLRTWLASLEEVIDHIAMERYGYEGVGSHQASIGEGGGIIKLELLEAFNAPVCFPSLPTSNQIKKFATGKGTGGKDEMRLGVYKRWGFEHRSNDVVDAYAAAQIARAFANPTIELIQPQREVIDAMKNPPKKKGKSGPPSWHAEMPVNMRYNLLH